MVGEALAAVIGFGQPIVLQHGAHAAIEYQDAFGQQAAEGAVLAAVEAVVIRDLEETYLVDLVAVNMVVQLVKFVAKVT